MSTDEEIRGVIEAAETSAWLRQALQTALDRDCVDAANDAEQLNVLLSRHCMAKLMRVVGHE